MRIAYLSAGAGSLHCGACTHDFLVVASLRQLAHEVRVVPLYTPVRSDFGRLQPNAPIYLGGINTYLRVHKPALARALKVLRPVLDSSALLTVATRGVIETSPAQLGEITLSVLQGAAGPHAAEFSRLLRHIRHLAPDVIFLTNSMLAPIATLLSADKPIPTVSGFLGEDTFIMGLSEPYRAQCINLIRQHARSLQAVLCPSQAAISQATMLLDLKPDQTQVVPAPMDVDLYARPAAPAQRDPTPTVGYLSVIRPAKGLDLMIRALHRVSDTIIEPFRILIAGQVVDPAYFRAVRELIDRLPSHIDVQLLGEVSLEQKVAMLHRCDVMCLPSRIAETRAMAAMEAMAAGVPVIAPANGTFPELLKTGGGWLFEAENADDLARRLTTALQRPDLRAQASEKAAAHVRAHHHPQTVAQHLESALHRARTPSQLPHPHQTHHPAA